jgi:uncharacterized protein (DUF2141 family)
MSHFWSLPTTCVATAGLVLHGLIGGAQTVHSTLPGVVINDEGRTVVGATVVLVSEDDGVKQTTTTGLDGTFRFENIQPGRYGVRAMKPGYLDGELGARALGRPGTPLAVKPQPLLAPVTITIWKGSVITGVVRDHLSAPLPGVDVFGVAETPANAGGQTRWLRAAAITDGEGRYRLFGLGPGQYLVGAKRPASGHGAIGLRQPQQIDAAIAQLSAGRLVPEAGLAADSYVAAPAYFPGVTDPTLAQLVAVSAADERSGVDLVLSFVRTSVIRGIVRRPDGSPGLGAQISVRRVDSPLPPDLEAVPEITQPRMDGSFVIGSLVPGKYVVTALLSNSNGQTPRRAPGQGAPGLWARTSLQASADVNQPSLTLDLGPTLNISGTLHQSTGLTGQGNSTAPSNLVLGVRLLDRTSQGGEAYFATVRGQRFDITGILPGRYEVFVGAVGSSQPWMMSSVATGGRNLPDETVAVDLQDINDLVVLLTDRLTEISGLLVAPNGLPASDYYVIVFPENRGLWSIGAKRIRAVRPATDGRYIVRGLPAGAYRVAVFPDDVSDDWLSPTFLDGLVRDSLSIRLKDGERVAQDLRIAPRSALSLQSPDPLAALADTLGVRRR